MRSELAPLLRGMSPRVVNGVELWELPWALVAIGGIGASAASRAAEFAIAEARPELLVSAGFAGALRTELKAGEVVQVGEVVDAANGIRFLADHGNLVLVSSSGVVGTADKNRLAAEFGADIVDMEAAAVARAAIKRGIVLRCHQGYLGRTGVHHASGQSVCGRSREVRHPGVCRPHRPAATLVDTGTAVGAE